MYVHMCVYGGHVYIHMCVVYVEARGQQWLLLLRYSQSLYFLQQGLSLVWKLLRLAMLAAH